MPAQEFNETDSAVHQPATIAPSSFGTPATPAGTDVGGTAALRGDPESHGPVISSAGKGGGTSTPSGVQSFTDGTV